MRANPKSTHSVSVDHDPDTPVPTARPTSRPCSPASQPSSHRHADLAKETYLDDPAFVAYLEYLRYWERPEYARFIHYPHALFFLDQLQRKEFRRAMANPRAVEHVFSQQFYHWQKFRTEQLAAAQATDGAAV